MNFWYHLLIIVLCRGIGIATIVFGVNLIPYKQWLPFQDHIYDWFVCIGAILAYVVVFLKIARAVDGKVSKKLKERRKKKEGEDNGLH